MSTLDELLAGFPPPLEVSTKDVQRAISKAEGVVLVVLDDDPTGTQSVADLPVLTAWEEEDFQWAFLEKKPAVYVMTNSRSLDPAAASAVTAEVVRAAWDVASRMNLNPVFVSRSDSTLRGHFPLETDVIAEVLAEKGQNVDGVILIPAFGEAGRVTVDGVHYARVKDEYLPAGETEFAKDATFGYEASRLADWVEEKTNGRVPSADVVSVNLAALRTNPGTVLESLLALRSGQIFTSDIVTETDLRALSVCLLEAQSLGQRFIYRVGPPFVRAFIGQEQRIPLTVEDVDNARRAAGSNGALPGREPTTGGLVVVGSHVNLTTRQLTHLTEHVAACRLEVDVSKVIGGGDVDAYIDTLVDQAVKALGEETVIVQTSRTLIKGASGDESLDISRRVSEAVVSIVKKILTQVTPRFVLAKGGITSSDVASKGLQIRHAKVIGPMLPGIVSLWMAQDGPAQGVPYIVFAGNVGDESSLTEVAKTLQSSNAPSNV